MSSISLKDIKATLANNIKNIIGWRTRRKIVVISVDDYGNVRIDSKEAREKMNRKGLKVHNRFDAFDTLETREDLEFLYEVLTSVKDRNGRYAVFTPFALTCNINFEKMAETGFDEYYYELLPETFKKLSVQQPEAYVGAWKLLKEGIQKGLITPQFHGREHFNLKVFEEKLNTNDHEVLTALKNRSYPGITSSGYESISPMAAFDFWEFEENKNFHNIIEEGLIQFNNIYGYRAQNFTPPVYNAHPVLYKTLKKNGIHFLDTAMYVKEHHGKGKYKRKINYSGKKTDEGICLIIRNVVFEPTLEKDFHWPSYAMKQIEAAFRWNRPAIISSHRVNFCGHIDEENRRKGLEALKELLKKITDRWPEVEFMAANELGNLIASEQEQMN